MRRRLLLALPLAAAACGSRDPEIPLATGPLGFRHLLPLRLNVAQIELPEVLPIPGPGDLGAETSVPPAQALRQMAEERLFAFGGSGVARFSILQARLAREAGGLSCVLACRVEAVTAEGARHFAEASAQARITLPDRVQPETRRRAAEAVLRQALERLNVEFEFQVRRNLRPLLVEGSQGGAAAPPAGGVEREDLPRP